MVMMTNSCRRRALGGALLSLLCSLACVACNQHADAKTAFTNDDVRPDVLPVMLNKELPFHYPPVLYAEKVQGNVVLRLYVNADGSVVNDSTRVAESSNNATLDSAALKGARDLRFVPAKRHGTPMPVSILFPVYFRHPEVPPPAGDTLLRKTLPPAAVPGDSPR